MNDRADAYIHGYETPEQLRLVEQAEHWRYSLICDGTELAPGTRLLEIGCGVGAVLAVLGQEYPGVRLHGVDIEPRQLEFARRHLARSGVEATLQQGDALALPYPDASFDHVWMMWVLEHIVDAPAVVREAFRVLAPGGTITAIEADYVSVRVRPSSPGLEAVFRAAAEAMGQAGWNDAGSRLPGWLGAAGFEQIGPGERELWFEGAELETQVRYVLEVMDAIFGPAATGDPPADVRAGLEDLRLLPSRPGAGIGWTVHKATARRPLA